MDSARSEASKIACSPGAGVGRSGDETGHDFIDMVRVAALQHVDMVRVAALPFFSASLVVKLRGNKNCAPPEVSSRERGKKNAPENGAV